MSFLDTLKASLALPQVPAHEFRTHPRRDDLVHVFVEGGADVVFFRKQMEKVLPDVECVFYDCGGKPNVYHTRTTIFGIPHKSKCLYVVDRDLDPYIQPVVMEADVFETEHYSVEWYALTARPIRTFFGNFFREQPLNEFLDHAETQFGDGLKVVQRVSLPYVAYALAARRAGRKVRFSDVRMRDLVDTSPTLEARACSGGRKKWVRDSSGGTPHTVSYSALSAALRLLRETDVSLWLRGHFATEFLARFLSRLIGAVAEDLKGHPGFTELRQFTAQINERTVFTVLSDRAAIVPAFDRYVRSVVGLPV